MANINSKNVSNCNKQLFIHLNQFESFNNQKEQPFWSASHQQFRNMSMNRNTQSIHAKFKANMASHKTLVPPAFDPSKRINHRLYPMDEYKSQQQNQKHTPLKNITSVLNTSKGSHKRNQSKSKPRSKVLGRVSQTYKNIQPIGRQHMAQPYQPVRLSGLTSIIQKRASDKSAPQSGRKQQIELRNQKFQIQNSKVDNAKMQYADYKERVQSLASNKPIHRPQIMKNRQNKPHINKDLSLNSPEAGPKQELELNPTQMVSSSQKGGTYDTGAMLDRTTQGEPFSNGQSFKSGTKEEGSYCVDDDEEDCEMDSDSFEDINHPADEDSQANMTVESQQRDLNKSAYAALPQKRDPEPDSALTITDSLERDPDQQSVEQAEPVIEEDVGHTVLGPGSANEESHCVDDSRSGDNLNQSNGDEDLDGRHDTVVMIDDQGKADDVASGHSFQLKDKLEIVSHSAEAECSDIKTNHTPVKLPDRSFLVPLRSSEKKGEFQRTMQHMQIQSEFGQSKSNEGTAQKAPVTVTKDDSTNNITSIHTKDETLAQSASGHTRSLTQYHERLTEGKPEGGPAECLEPQQMITASLDSNAFYKQTRNNQGLPELIPTKQTLDEEDQRRGLVRKFEEQNMNATQQVQSQMSDKPQESLILPANKARRKASHHNAKRLVLEKKSLNIQVENRRKSLEARPFASGTSKGGSTSVKSGYSSTLSKTGGQNHKGSPFRAVLAHQQRSINFSFPKETRGLLPTGKRKTPTNGNRKMKSTDANEAQKYEVPSSPGQQAVNTEEKAIQADNTEVARAEDYDCYVYNDTGQVNNKLFSRSKRSSISSIQDMKLVSTNNFQSMQHSGKKEQIQHEEAVYQQNTMDARNHDTANQVYSSAISSNILESQTNQQAFPTLVTGSDRGLDNKDSVGQIPAHIPQMNVHEPEQFLQENYNVFNKTTNMQVQGISLMSFDCASSQMFQPPSIQGSSQHTATLPEQARLVSHQSTGQFSTLRNAAAQAHTPVAHDLPQSRQSRQEVSSSATYGQAFSLPLSDNKQQSHTQGTLSCYVDDVSSSQCINQSRQSASKTDQLPSSENTTNNRHSRDANSQHTLTQLQSSNSQYNQQLQSFQQLQDTVMKVDREVSSFEVTMQDHSQTMQNSAEKRRPLLEGENGVPQPHYLTQMPYVPNKELQRVQQRIQEQEQRLYHHQQLIQRQTVDFQDQLQMQRNGYKMQDNQSFCNSKKFEQIFDVNYDQQPLDMQAQYNQMNSNSIRTAKFNHNLEGSTQSVGENENQCAPQVQDSIIYHNQSSIQTVQTGGGYPDQEAYMNQNDGPDDMTSPSIDEYATAKCFDDRIDLIGAGEITNTNPDQTENADSSVLSNSLPFQSSKLQQIFHDIQDQRHQQNEERVIDLQPYQQQVHRTEEDIIQDAINSMAMADIISSKEMEKAGLNEVVNGKVFNQCMNYNVYLEHQKKKRQTKNRSSLKGSDDSSQRSCSRSRQQSRPSRSHQSSQNHMYKRSDSHASGNSKGNSKLHSKKGSAKNSSVLPPWNQSTKLPTNTILNTQDTEKQEGSRRKSSKISRPRHSSGNIAAHQLLPHNRSSSRRLLERVRDQQKKERKRSQNSQKSQHQRRTGSRQRMSTNSSRGSTGQRQNRSQQHIPGPQMREMEFAMNAPKQLESPQFEYKMETQTLELERMKQEMVNQSNMCQQMQPRQNTEELQGEMNNLLQLRSHQNIYCKPDQEPTFENQNQASDNQLTYIDQHDQQLIEQQPIDFYNCQSHSGTHTQESKESLENHRPQQEHHDGVGSFEGQQEMVESYGQQQEHAGSLGSYQNQSEALGSFPEGREQSLQSHQEGGRIICSQGALPQPREEIEPCQEQRQQQIYSQGSFQNLGYMNPQEQPSDSNSYSQQHNESLQIHDQSTQQPMEQINNYMVQKGIGQMGVASMDKQSTEQYATGYDDSHQTHAQRNNESPSTNNAYQDDINNYGDFVRLNHLNSYNDSIIRQDMEDQGFQEEFYDMDNSNHQTLIQPISINPQHVNLNHPQFMNLINQNNTVQIQQYQPQFRNDLKINEERMAIIENRLMQEQGEPSQATTQEKSTMLTGERSQSISQPRTWNNANGKQSPNGDERKSRSRNRSKKKNSAERIDLSLAPTDSIDAYMKVVKNRILSKKRRSNSTDYQKRYLGYSKTKPQVRSNSKSRTSAVNISGMKARGGSKNRSNSRNRTLNLSLDRSDLTAIEQGKLKNEIAQKQQLQSLKSALAKQKQHEKALLEKHNLIKKQQIVQTKKQATLIENQNQQIFERIQKKKRINKKTVDEGRIAMNQKEGEEKVIDAHQIDLEELVNLKQTLMNELEIEQKLVSDIKAITHKYKRLLAEQTREKERLAHAVRGQQKKILTNLKGRSQVLKEDNDKLMNDFKKTIVKDTNILEMNKKTTKHGKRKSSIHRGSFKQLKSVQ